MQKIITLKCSCGAEIELRDDRESYINGGGKADEKGRIFQVEVQADNWLDRHQGCVRARQQGRDIAKEPPRTLRSTAEEFDG